jgi:hypothetical protein
MNKRTEVALQNGCQIELLVTEQNEFVGIGEVRVGDVALRSAARPMVVRFDTPEGVLYSRLLVTNSAEGRIEMTAVGLPWGKAEYADQYNQPQMSLTLPTSAIEDHLTLTLAPQSLELGGRAWSGFSYALEFRSASRHIHRLWTHGTWEIGGTITGNTVLHQGQCNMPVYRGAKESLFTTACLKTLQQHGNPQGMSYQLAPRGGLLQAFDFQFSTAGALLMFWPQFASILSVVESPAGSEVLHILDEHHFPLATSAAPPAKWVLFCPGPLTEHEARDLWWTAHEHVYGGIRKSFRVQATLVLPEVNMRYSTRVHEGRLRMTVCGEEVDSHDVPYAVADKLLPLLVRQGIRRFFPEVMSQSDVTEHGMKRKLDDGMHGELHCSSVCSTHRFLPAEFWGGMKAWRYMADKARALGIEIGAWFAPHLSPRAPIFQEHPEYRMIAANTEMDGGGYGFTSIIAADWNTGIREWVRNDFQRWKEEGGLDYIFTDSWANMGLLQQNFSAAMRTNFEALGRFYADLQQIGIKSHSFEGISPFGMSRFGIADLRGTLLGAREGIVGQNDFGWWVGEEDMAFGICLMVNDRKRTPQELERILFRLMANRAFAGFDNQYDGLYNLPDWWVRLNHIYWQAFPLMNTRRMMPSGMLWQGKAASVLWVYHDTLQEAILSSDRMKMLRIEPQGLAPLDCEGGLKLESGSVYVIQPG